MRFFRIGVLALAAAVALQPFPANTPVIGEAAAPTTASAQTNWCWSWRAPEVRLMRLTNRARLNRGINRARRSRHLARVARVHTREMIRQNLLHHQSTRQLSSRVTRWVVLGENVGVGGTPASLQQAFMNSPAHRANLLDGQFRFIGVGGMRAHGRLWVTVIFSARERPGTTLTVPPLC